MQPSAQLADYHQLHSANAASNNPLGEASLYHAHNEMAQQQQHHHQQQQQHHYQQQYYQQQFALSQQQQQQNQSNYSINGILGIEQQRHLKAAQQHQQQQQQLDLHASGHLGGQQGRLCSSSNSTSSSVKEKCDSPLDVVDSRSQFESLKLTHNNNSSDKLPVESNGKSARKAKRSLAKKSRETSCDEPLELAGVSRHEESDDLAENKQRTAPNEINGNKNNDVQPEKEDDESNEAIDLESIDDQARAGKLRAFWKLLK